MCSACAAAAVAGASGARSYLQAQGWAWLTPARLKRITAALCVAALGVTTIGFSGSSHDGATAPVAAPAQHARS